MKYKIVQLAHGEKGRVMLTIRSIVVKNMRRITFIMVVVILLVSTVIQIFNMHKTSQRNAMQIFSQVEQILDENSAELEQVREEYKAMCLNDARTVAYILKYNPEARFDVEELNKIAANAEVDEIHIFDENGVIVAGSRPQYIGLSMDSGEQIGFFKPLLADKSLELVQDVTPNTAESRMVQYSALWSEDGDFILQIGMYPATLLRATQKNELSHIFSLLRTGMGYNLYAVDPETGTVVGSTVAGDVDKNISEIGFPPDKLASGEAFHAKLGQVPSYCMAKRIAGSDVVWTMPSSELLGSVLVNQILLLAGLVLVAWILVYAVSSTMDRDVVRQIERVNEKLEAIQNGDLNTQVDVWGSKEFLELSGHINTMVDSLLQSTEKLELSERIQEQNEELERQREQLEVAVVQAEAANRAKSEFLFNMSHDIRTPMNAILGFTNLALESGDPETQREYLKNIDVSSKQMLALIDNILELARIENHRIMIEEGMVNFEEECQKLSTIFENDLKKKNLIYTVKTDVKHPYMYVDVTHYSQIFLNIVSNAIKYTPDGGTIAVSFKELAGETPGTCVMETVIEDTGIGMSSEFLEHAYESFARERTSTVSGLQGTGLGLTIVKNLVDLMRGTICIQSRQGKGTKVTVLLPHRLGEAPAEKHGSELETMDPGLLEGRYILLVEDIDINAMIATKLLTSRGCLVDRAKDGVECIDMLLKAETGYYDLVLMDIQMPNMDGYQATQSIRAFEDKKKASIPILAMTANAFQEDCEKAFESGMDGHIAKPLDVAKMFRIITEALKDK